MAGLANFHSAVNYFFISMVNIKKIKKEKKMTLWVEINSQFSIIDLKKVVFVVGGMGRVTALNILH